MLGEARNQLRFYSWEESSRILSSGNLKNGFSGFQKLSLIDYYGGTRPREAER